MVFQYGLLQFGHVIGKDKLVLPMPLFSFLCIPHREQDVQHAYRTRTIYLVRCDAKEILKEACTEDKISSESTVCKHVEGHVEH